MSAETGESTASLSRSWDHQAWRGGILDAMRRGAILRWHPKIKRLVVEWPDGSDAECPGGRSLSQAAARRLERDGVIEICGVDRYRLRREP